jgi:FkbM family methyltransferase
MTHPTSVLARYTPHSLRQLIRHNRRIDAFARKVYSVLVKFGGSTAVIEAGPLMGLKLATGQHTSHKYLAGTYEIETQRALDRLLKPGMVCYDLGASIGYMTLLMARHAKHVYAFEPAPHAAVEIQRNVTANGFTNVTVIPHPVSDETRTVSFSLTNNAYGSAITRDDKWPTITVDTLTLDAFAKSHEFPDLIKIDVENEEFRALRGAREVLQRKPLICCEIHSVESGRGVERILSSNGYRITTLEGHPFTVPETVVEGELQVLGFPS